MLLALSGAPGRFPGATALTATNAVGQVVLNWTASSAAGVMAYTVQELVGGVWVDRGTTAGLTSTQTMAVGLHTFRVRTDRGGGHYGTDSNQASGWSMQLRSQTFTTDGVWDPPGAPVSTVEVWMVGAGGRQALAGADGSGGGGGGGVVHAVGFAVAGPLAVVFKPRVEGVQFHGASVAFGSLRAGGGGDGGNNSTSGFNVWGSAGDDYGPSNGGGAGNADNGNRGEPGPGLNGGYPGGTLPAEANQAGVYRSTPSGGGGADGAGGAGALYATFQNPALYAPGAGGAGISSPIGVLGAGGGGAWSANETPTAAGYGTGGGNTSGSEGTGGAVHVIWTS